MSRFVRQTVTFDMQKCHLLQGKVSPFSGQFFIPETVILLMVFDRCCFFVLQVKVSVMAKVCFFCTFRLWMILHGNHESRRDICCGVLYDTLQSHHHTGLAVYPRHPAHDALEHAVDDTHLPAFAEMALLGRD